jgi:chromosome segregation ATPase
MTIQDITLIIEKWIPWIMLLIGTGGGLGIAKFMLGERAEIKSRTRQNDIGTLNMLTGMVEKLSKSIIQLQEDQSKLFDLEKKLQELENENSKLVSQADTYRKDFEHERRRGEELQASWDNIHDAMVKQIAVLKGGYDARGETIARLEFVLWKVYDQIDNYRAKAGEPPIQRQSSVPNFGVTP